MQLKNNLTIIKKKNSLKKVSILLSCFMQCRSSIIKMVKNFKMLMLSWSRAPCVFHTKHISFKSKERKNPRFTNAMFYKKLHILGKTNT